MHAPCKTQVYIYAYMYIYMCAPSPLQTFHPLRAPSSYHHHWITPKPGTGDPTALAGDSSQPGSARGLHMGTAPEASQGRCCRGLPIALQTCKKYSLRILTYQNPGPPFSLGASFVLVSTLEKLGTGASPLITRSKGPLS